MTTSDQELVLDYINGDEQSLKNLIERYLSSIYNFVYHLCGNKQDAEDITQEVFVKVWKNIKKYKPEQNFKTWIFSVARNTAIDWLRKRKNLVFSDFETENGENVIENTISDDNHRTDELAILYENKKILYKAMEKLSPIHQSILIMRYNEEFTFKEIGEILDKPMDTVKSQHHRALLQLKKILGDAPN